jgi:hypothetical protein
MTTVNVSLLSWLRTGLQAFWLKLLSWSVLVPPKTMTLVLEEPISSATRFRSSSATGPGPSGITFPAEDCFMAAGVATAV